MSLGVVFLLGFSVAGAADAAPSQFSIACMQGGGTAGQALVRNGNNNQRLYVASASRLSLSFSPVGPNEVSSISLVRKETPTGQPVSFAMRPGDAAIFNASELTLENMGGTVGKAVDYCLRVL